MITKYVWECCLYYEYIDNNWRKAKKITYWTILACLTLSIFTLLGDLVLLPLELLTLIIGKIIIKEEE